MSRGKLLAAAFGAAGLVAAIAFAGVDTVGQAVERVGVAGLIIVALIHLPVIALTGSAWSAIGNDVSGASTWKFIWARYVREATGEVLPFSQLGGIVAGVRVLSLAGLGTVPVIGSMLADILIEQAAKLPYVLAGAVLLLTAHRNPSFHVIAYAVLPALVLTIAAIAGRKRVVSLLHRAVHEFATRVPGLRIGDSAQMRSLDRLVEGDRRTLAALACHTLAWVLGAAETWVIFRLMGVAVTGPGAFIIDALYCGLRTFGFAVPGALGVQEAGYMLACALLGIPAAPAIALSLIRRVRELLIGIPALSAWQLIESRRAISGLTDD